jgi:hypothetical protein
MKLKDHPIFIVGYPRSGTTLLQALLCTQDRIFSLRETHYFNVIEKRLRFDTSGFVDPASIDGFFEAVMQKTEYSFNPDEVERIRAIAANDRITTIALFEILVERLLEETYPGMVLPDSFWWIEKTPNHALFMPRITSLYPETRFIHVLRHPVPSIFSRKINFPFNHDIPLDELAQRWRDMASSIEEFRALKPHAIMTVRYEDIASDPLSEMAKICLFLGISFDPSPVGEYRDNFRRFSMESEPWKLRDRNKNLVDTNRNYRDRFSNDDVALIEKVLAPELVRYGYTCYEF